MLAHELRNPLAPIRNASEVLGRTLPSQEAPQVAVGIIKRQVTQLTRLVDDLLDVSRITQGRIELRKEPLELASVIDHAVETVGPMLREKHHEILIAPSEDPLYVTGDSARLTQCVVNLLTNAIKYTDSGGHIRVHTRRSDSVAVVTISDDGAGIPRELLPRIFDLFVQGDRTLDRAQGGLGIGLSVLKKLIEMHGGEVSARSPGVGHGSSFEIRLPLIEEPGAMSPGSTGERAPRRRVLVVDDNVDAANSLALVLRLDGHETEAVYTAYDALEHAATFKPDVVLLDIGLPQLDGYEVARRLRSSPELRGICLVALTGYGQSEDRQRARAAGFDFHLVKPVDFELLARTLSSAAMRH
jgi:CheY-like chemotaxis protein